MGGQGVLEPKSPKVCAPKTAQINISFCKTSSFPAMKSGSEGSEGGGVLAPPPREVLDGRGVLAPPREVLEGGGVLAPPGKY